MVSMVIIMVNMAFMVNMVVIVGTMVMVAQLSLVAMMDMVMMVIILIISLMVTFIRLNLNLAFIITFKIKNKQKIQIFEIQL